MDERQILKLLLQRSEKAIELLQDKYDKLCYSTARRILPDPRDAEECVSDAVLRVWNTIPPEKPRSLGAYIQRITRNLALDKYDYNNAACRQSALVSAFEELEPYLPSGGKELEELEFRRVLNQFLRSLPEKTRICFIRRYWYGESVRELAEHCGLTEQMVKTLLFRTRNKMRQQLEKEGIRL